jgi:hypothetical protein
MTETPSSPEQTPEPRSTRETAADKARRAKVQEQLDEALAASFPASDPVSIVTSQQEED